MIASLYFLCNTLSILSDILDIIKVLPICTTAWKRYNTANAIMTIFKFTSLGWSMISSKIPVPRIPIPAITNENKTVNIMDHLFCGINSIKEDCFLLNVFFLFAKFLMLTTYPVNKSLNSSWEIRMFPLTGSLMLILLFFIFLTII